jgi:hypothetical protein
MYKFEAFSELYYILKVKNNLKKHWTNGSGWGMVKAMHDIIFTFIKTIMQGANFFFANANEVVIMDN